MNQFLSALIPTQIGTMTGSMFKGAAAPSASASANAGLFSAQLAQRINTLVKPAATAGNLKTWQPQATAAQPADANASAVAKLEKSILDQLNAGTSATDIANGLAASLATQVAQQLGVTTDNARMQLQTAFASALAPPGTAGPPQTTAEIARTLAQQFAKVADAATRVASNGESGQLNRLVGNILDANTAKETLAPAETNTAAKSASVTGTTVAVADSVAHDTSDSDKVARALVAFQAQLTTPTQNPSVAANPVTIAAAAASDGRTVKLETTQAIATAGDTPLGRILARAAQSADLAPSTAAPADGEATGALQGQPLLRSLSDADVTAFLHTFASATSGSGSGVPAGKTRDGETFASLLMSTPGSTDSAASFMPVAPPFTIDNAQNTPTVNAPPLPQAATDANNVVGQILQGAFLKNLGQSNQIRMQLVPEHLGEVNIKLTVTGGNVSAHIIAQTPEVHDALVAGQSQLTKSLADAGLKLTSFSVDVANNGFAGFAQQQSQSQQRSSQGRRTLLGGDADDSGETLQAIPSFGPPILAQQNFGSLNYLV
jgi:flagellar hook-length control protein FliK